MEPRSLDRAMAWALFWAEHVLTLTPAQQLRVLLQFLELQPTTAHPDEWPNEQRRFTRDR